MRWIALLLLVPARNAAAEPATMRISAGAGTDGSIHTEACDAPAALRSLDVEVLASGAPTQAGGGLGIASLSPPQYGCDPDDAAGKGHGIAARAFAAVTQSRRTERWLGFAQLAVGVELVRFRSVWPPAQDLFNKDVTWIGPTIEAVIGGAVRVDRYAFGLAGSLGAARIVGTDTIDWSASAGLRLQLRAFASVELD